MEDCMQACSFCLTLCPFTGSVFTVYCCFRRHFVSLPILFPTLSPLFYLTPSLFLSDSSMAPLGGNYEKLNRDTHSGCWNKAFNTFYSPSLHYNSKRLGVREGGSGRVCRYYQDIFREWCWGENAALLSPNFYAPSSLMQVSNDLYLLVSLRGKGLVWLCLANWQSCLQK